MKIIPAIDLSEGKCVRLQKGDFNLKTVYYDDPLDAARNFEDAGCTHLHLVDLDGARSGKIVHVDILSRIASHTSLSIDFGGGISDQSQLELALKNGAAQVTAGSFAAREPEQFNQWLQQYGPEKLILGADVKDEKIAVNGWQDTTDITLWDFLDTNTQLGVSKVICTDVSKDGMLAGPSTDLYQRILGRYPSLELIASGGVTTIDDLEVLKAAGIPGAIVGKSLYEGNISLQQLADWNAGTN